MVNKADGSRTQKTAYTLFPRYGRGWRGNIVRVRVKSSFMTLTVTQCVAGFEAIAFSSEDWTICSEKVHHHARYVKHMRSYYEMLRHPVLSFVAAMMPFS